MKRTLNDTDSHLLAFVIRGHDTRQVPHSAFHSLEATHMKTILSQLNDDEWYKAFNYLNPMEHGSLDRLVHPYAAGKIHEREVIVLKVIQQNRFNAWMALLREILQRYPAPYGSGRVLLAIVREKLVDGKPLLPFHRGGKQKSLCRSLMNNHKQTLVSNSISRVQTRILS